MKLSALVLTKNEESMIEDCLSQLGFADEIIVLDQNSKDQTAKKALKYTKQVLKTEKLAFDENRNMLAHLARGKWLLYLDADERLSPQLISEIKKVITTGDKSAYLGPQSANWRARTAEYSAFYFPRKNLILGKWLKHAGFWPDYVPRLFKKGSLVTWYGKVHESPKIRGDFGYLNCPVEHLTARTLNSMLGKSIKWAKIEAELFYEANHPKVTIFKVIKVSLFEFVARYFLKLGFLDGTIGLIQSIFQALHQAIVLTYLWEFQNDVVRQYEKIKGE